MSAAAWAVPAAVALVWGSAMAEAPVPRAIVWIVATLVVLVAVGLVPELRWRRWRYEVRPDEIDIRHGLVTIRRTLVPMRRVQHVDTGQGPLQRALGLATVTFHTAAGENEIPQLPEREAEEVRDRIAELTRQADEL